MSDKLTPDDADQLRDFADRNERAARTARLVAAAESEQVARMLTGLASHAEEAARQARAIAGLASTPDPEPYWER
jgi:hypothetical protein